MTRTCDVCWAEIKEEIWYLHISWHTGRTHHDIPQTSTCDQCFAIIRRDRELEHITWHEESMQ